MCILLRSISLLTYICQTRLGGTFGVPYNSTTSTATRQYVRVILPCCVVLTCPILIPDYDETLQAYSTFTTNYKPPDQYESILVQASKLRAQAVKAYQRRERSESSLVSTYIIVYSA